MFKILTLNKISAEGMALFDSENYEAKNNIENPDAVLVRSTDMYGMEIPSSVLAIARAGAGYNNIPVEKCSERGIVVFNTPGANANAVKELVLAVLFLSSRKIFEGVEWMKSLSGSKQELADIVEANKYLFSGPEIHGKTLGVAGLGAIGAAVANDALALGMEVIGYDPYISIDAAWKLSRSVCRADSLEQLLAKSDYITIHIPFSGDTKGFLNVNNIPFIKKGARLINMARGGLIDDCAIMTALDSGALSYYATDFPSSNLIAHKNVLCIPHLGASTPEAEINCAKMAVTQLKNFLETGAIKNSVNFPDCHLIGNECNRLLVANRNIPNMVGQITSTLAGENINITDLINHHKGNYAYNIIDTEQPISNNVLERLKKIEGVVRVRTMQK
ncbi:MAG: phosphoglycerate dehydrogenase [Spirochaetaceae bacterium]|jgi:D-3-phosphoglycerate dehydrogenase|nr:phosphoglycerate dehydrogenase [Spirochaetaceae bacterium]